MRIFKNKLFLGILCIAAGLLIGFVAMPKIQSRAAETVSAVVLKQPVKAGAQITEDMIATASLPKGIYPDALSEAADAVGMYAVTDLYTEDCLSAAKLSSSPEASNPMTAAAAKGKLVVSVTLPNLAAGVSARLLPGDIVTVMATPKNAGQSLGLEPETEETERTDGTAIVSGLENLEVCMVTTADAADARVNASPAKDEKNTLPVTISFYVTKEQAIRLAELEQSSAIHLAFVARGEAASQYIPGNGRMLVGTEAD